MDVPGRGHGCFSPFFSGVITSITTVCLTRPRFSHPSRSFPLTMMTSTVMPKPSIAFTSKTVHSSKSGMNMIFSVSRSCPRSIRDTIHPCQRPRFTTPRQCKGFQRKGLSNKGTKTKNPHQIAEGMIDPILLKLNWQTESSGNRLTPYLIRAVHSSISTLFRTVSTLASSQVTKLMTLYLTCVSLTSHSSRSGIPSPVMADVGTIDTVCIGSSFFQYNSVLRPFSITSVKNTNTTPFRYTSLFERTPPP